MHNLNKDNKETVLHNKEVKLPQKYKAFIFDFDGTLVDSMPIWSELGINYLNSINVKFDINTLKKDIYKSSFVEVANYFKDEFKLAKTTEQVMNEIVQLTWQKYKYEVPLKQGVKEFLEANSNVKMCIATACDSLLIKIAIERLGVDKYFDFVLTSTEVGNSKRDPKIFIESAKRLNVSIEECVIFEDSLHAIQTAKKAGFYVVGVADNLQGELVHQIKSLANQFVNTLTEVKL